MERRRPGHHRGMTTVALTIVAVLVVAALVVAGGGADRRVPVRRRRVVRTRAVAPVERVVEHRTYE